ncbi:50S ribosomal protein L18 [Methanosarcinaceae archaeon]|nr:50S ribosomal protein L18 [Methanosarcinaceae archaeon]MBQ3620522.1 50S ribosomal protein L18 [Methanosarcinaceae archaeon]
MATGPRYQVPMRRRKEGRTNYHTRLSLLISKRDRVVVRKSTRNTQIQLIAPTPVGDVTYSSAISTELGKFGYTGPTGNTTAAYLTGLLFGLRTLKAGYDSGILDIGLHASTPGSRVYAALKGMIDAGMDIPHDPSIFPSDDRISGQVAADYNGSDLPAQFEAAKENIRAEYE